MLNNSSNAIAISEQINALTGRGLNDNRNCTFAHLNLMKLIVFFSANLGPSITTNMLQAKFHHSMYVKSVPVCNSFHLASFTESKLFNIIHS